MNDQQELEEFADWLNQLAQELLNRMRDIRENWSDEDHKAIMMILSHEHILHLFKIDFVPAAAASWVTDQSPVADHFKDCKQRKWRQSLSRRNGRFKARRRSWGRK